MYCIIKTIESLFKGIRTFTKLLYYKIKYGKRLSLGKRIHFRKGFIINISKNGYVKIGDGTFFNNYCSINCHEKIIIGKNNLFGENVKIYDHNHVFNDKSKDIKRNFKSNCITIGNGNWFASNVVVLSKTKVGNNNVFGAGTIINSEYSSDNLVKTISSQSIDRIHYKKGDK